MGRKLAGKTCGLVLLVAMASPKAHAQRAISDYEASRLTLDALTATPVIRRVAAHHTVSHAARGHMAASRHALVHQVAYHPHAVAHASVARRHRHT